MQVTLAAVTSKIKLYATAPVLALPPAIVARMSTTIDSTPKGRFGINLITGWQRPEYAQMGIWPGDQFFATRYEYLAEYTTILRELWTPGRANFKGKHFQMDDCRMLPTPQTDIRLICAGSSDQGMAFSAQYADYNFCLGVGVNTPKGFVHSTEKLQAEVAKSGRNVGTFVLLMIIADETDAAAFAKWTAIKPALTTRQSPGSVSKPRPIRERTPISFKRQKPRQPSTSTGTLVGSVSVGRPHAGRGGNRARDSRSVAHIR